VVDASRDLEEDGDIVLGQVGLQSNVLKKQAAVELAAGSVRVRGGDHSGEEREVHEGLCQAQRAGSMDSFLTGY